MPDKQSRLDVARQLVPICADWYKAFYPPHVPAANGGVSLPSIQSADHALPEVITAVFSGNKLIAWYGSYRKGRTFIAKIVGQPTAIDTSLTAATFEPVERHIRKHKQITRYTFKRNEGTENLVEFRLEGR